MEVAVIVIAVCMTILTMFTLVALMVTTFLALRLASTLRRLEGTLHDLTRVTLPLLDDARVTMSEVKLIGHSVRVQVEQGQKIMSGTLESFSELGRSARSTFDTAVTAFKLIRKLLALFRRER